jgi:hypothetical protein
MTFGRGFAAVLTLSAIVSACGGEREASVSQRSIAVAAERTGEAGVTVKIPAGWHSGAPADGNVVDPLTRVVASSAPIRLRQVPCQIARYAPGPADVTLVVVEWKPSEAARPALRPARFTSETFEVHPPPAIECFGGPGGSVQFVDNGRVFGAYLLEGERASERLVEEALEVLNTLKVESPAATRRLSRNGVSVAVKTGWDGRVLFREAAGSWGVIFQVANFQLPANEGFERPRELPPGQEDPIKAMEAGDVLITVVSDEATGEPTSEPVTLDRLRFLPKAAPRVPRGHTLAEGSFCFDERCVRIEVDFGGRATEPTLRGDVDAVLASLAVDEGPRRSGAKADDGPRGCPRQNWPGPWTACAEADWVRHVVEVGA